MYIYIFLHKNTKTLSFLCGKRENSPLLNHAEGVYGIMPKACMESRRSCVCDHGKAVYGIDPKD